MTNYRPVDSKREEYRKYLERAGVMEILTRVLASLYEESDKGIDALEYVKKQLLGDHAKEQTSSEEELKSQIEALLVENKMLRKRLSQYEEIQPSVTVPSSSKTPSPLKMDTHSDHSKSSGQSNSEQHAFETTTSN